MKILAKAPRAQFKFVHSGNLVDQVATKIFTEGNCGMVRINAFLC